MLWESPVLNESLTFSNTVSCMSWHAFDKSFVILGQGIQQRIMDLIGPRIRAILIAVLSALGALLFGLDIGLPRCLFFVLLLSIIC